MLQSFTAKNFRGLSDVTIGSPTSPLARVNLIAGRNDVGKTALIEAILLHIGPDNPGLPLVVNAIRGLEYFSLDAAEMWGWLFPKADVEETIELSSVDDQGTPRRLRIRLAASSSIPVVVPSGAKNGTPSSTSLSTTPAVSLPPSPGGSLSTALLSSELRLEYSVGRHRAVVSKAQITSAGPRIERATIESTPLGIYLGSHSRTYADDAERFSKLEQVGREGDVLQPLKRLDERIKRLALSMLGGKSIVHCDIGIGRLIPIMYLGGGCVKLLSIVLAIATAKDGFVLVDEIENGFHYSVHEQVWQVIGAVARENNVQLFATTHSWECIKAAHSAFSRERKYDFRLFRLERVDSAIRAVAYTKRTLATSVEMNMEVR
jgi:hypothetical protein